MFSENTLKHRARKKIWILHCYLLASFAYIVNNQVIVAFQTNNSPNPFFPNAPFLYPLKTENRKVFWSFQGVEKSCIGNEWINSELKVLNNCILDREIYNLYNFHKIRCRQKKQVSVLVLFMVIDKTSSKLNETTFLD